MEKPIQSSNGLVADFRLKAGHFLLEGIQIQLSQKGLKCSWKLISPLKLRELDFQPHRCFDLLSMVMEENFLSNTTQGTFSQGKSVSAVYKE